MKSASPFSAFHRFGFFFILILLALAVSTVEAQYCMEYDPPDYFNTSDDCRSMPEIDRALQPSTFFWNGHEYMMFSRGNELEMVDFSDPTNPIREDRSLFRVGNQGDADYELLLYGNCDDCRYGFSVHTLATVFFDLGSGGEPDFVSFVKDYDLGDLDGGMTFKHNGTQYLIIDDAIQNDVCGGSSGIFIFNGTNPSALQHVGCVDKPNNQEFHARGGLYLQDPSYNNGQAFLWLSTGVEFWIFEVEQPGGPDTLRVQPINRLTGGGAKGRGLRGAAVNFDEGLAVTASYQEKLKIWSLAGGDLANPQLKSTLSNVSTYWLALQDRIVITGEYGSEEPLYSFDLTSLTNPQPLDQGYWDFSHPWNDLTCVAPNLGATFTASGDYLFTARWAQLQRHDFRNCNGPQAPTARVTLGRWNTNTQSCGTLVGDVFPGDAICAKNTSTGDDITSTELWITDALGNEVAETSGGADAGPLDYTVPIGGTAGEPSSSYTAHVRVTNGVGTTQDTETTSVNLEPDATITYEPVAPLTGENLTLSGEGEGRPGLPDGGDPFEWTVVPPVGEAFILTGSDPAPFNLGDAGTYDIELNVHYRHGAVSPYVAVETLSLDISSVAAAFSISPANPVNTEDIVLDGSDSRWSVGVIPQWTWEYRATSGAWTELTFCSGETCTIPGDEDNPFFDPGAYFFRLTLTDNGSGDSSTTEPLSVDINDGTINLDFHWNPTTPGTGQNVNFYVDGVSSVDAVTWQYGGPNCDGDPQTWTCTPVDGTALDCLSTVYKYSTSGQKTVRMTATVNGVQQNTVTKTVTVTNGDGCGGGGGGGGGTTCTYGISPIYQSVDAGGGNYAVSVSTQSGCPWVANENIGWVEITSGSSGNGPGNVLYSVDPNTSGSTRTGTMTVAGRTHTVTQSDPVPVDFTWTPDSPDIGDEVTFSVTDSRVTPIRWEFGSAHCDGTSAVFDCSFLTDFCRNITWEYPAGGWKTVTLVAEEGEKTRGIQVRNAGECCFKDGPPVANFTVTPNPAFTRQEVVFSDASLKSEPIDGGKTEAVGFTWDPVNPSAGERITFTVTGVGGVSSAEWDMGGPGCGNFEQESTCTPLPPAIDCLTWYHEYSSGGTKTVTLTINGGQSPISQDVTIGAGSCDGGGGGGGCTYAITPNGRNFTQNGGNGTITVSTTADCDWAASENAGWITITAGSSGQGAGTVSYTVDPNTGNARSAVITVGGKNHSVSQAAYEGPQDTEPAEWSWQVSLGGQVVVTSDQPSFVYEFEEPGVYEIRYEVSNCDGNDVAFGQLVVEQAPVIIPEAYLVPSAVHAPGLNDTSWRTDLRIFNPDVNTVVLNIEYQPENTDNSGGDTLGIYLDVDPLGTVAYDDILELIPGIITDADGSYSGSISITYTNGGEDEVPPMIISRTYNETPDGTFGQFVPAVPVIEGDDNRAFLTGLVHNLYYRTNIRLANTGTESAVATITLIDQYGDVLGDPIYPSIQPGSTTQINGVAERAGVSTFLDTFSVQVDLGSPDVGSWASIVDNQTGDPVLYSQFLLTGEEEKLWVPGLARLAGTNDSEWRSDVSFFNPKNETISFDIHYIPSEDLGIQPYRRIRGFDPGHTLFFSNMLSEMVPAGVESKGYFIIEPFGGELLPQVAARTYNVDVSTGTFGQSLFVFRETDFIEVGLRGFIPGVAVAETNQIGFRTNVGLLNSDQDAWAQVQMTALDESGQVIGEITEIWLGPGELKQFSLKERLDLPSVDATVSVIVEVLEGGPVGAYGSTVDNRTQDPILIPAIPDITQLAP